MDFLVVQKIISYLKLIILGVVSALMAAQTKSAHKAFYRLKNILFPVHPEHAERVKKEIEYWEDFFGKMKRK